jgi:ATP-dependent helicase/nuclease subunit A
MPEKTFTIYKSSAGSGKTRTLAKEYLKLALHFKAGYFKHILAVTFTNKATQEMKERIIHYLNAFVKGEEDSLARELKAELNLDDNSFQQNCHELRNGILHHYAQFSISTIDAFFQRVIRSFTRESGLSGDYRLELDHHAVLAEVIDALMDELGKNEDLTRWMIEFAEDNLASEKAWDVRHGLIEFAREIFREDFKAIEDELNTVTGKENFFPNLIKELRKQKHEYVNVIKKKAEQAVQQIQAAGLEDSDFKYGNGGGFGWFKKVSQISTAAEFQSDDVGKRPAKEYQLAKNWPSKESNQAEVTEKLATEKLVPLMNDILKYRETYHQAALSAEVVLNNFYAFGLLSDISRKLKEYKATNNLMLLSDAPKFLNGVIGESDTPFIYEKVGSFYRNYLIDEFQDTSGMQWNNFYPLVTNSLDSGYKSLVVGDVKQAIYRWRGGNLSLLQKQISDQIGEQRVEVKELTSNYRSTEHVISFNNSLFKIAARKVAELTSGTMATDVYNEVVQQFSSKEKGFVQVSFIPHEDDQKWKDSAKAKLVSMMEHLQESGVPLKDIAILVRTNDEGQSIVNYVLEHKYSSSAKSGCKYDIISNESLRIDGSGSVNLVLSALRYLHNPDDTIARAELAYEYVRIHRPDALLSETFLVTNMVAFEKHLPDSFTKQKVSLKKLPLFELTESLIQVFSLTNQYGDLAYLQAFQDIVLNFNGRERNDLQAFLEWWEDNKNTDKTSLKTSGDIDAAQILTIHKSKGLQFRYVIVPFCAWSLDHASGKSPNLWVKAEQGIFKEARFLPVRYSSVLMETYFHEAYQQERTHTFLDNLNIMYVAFTRAERGLLVVAPLPKRDDSKLTAVSSLLHGCIQTDESLKQYWDEGNKEWKLGDLKGVGKEEKMVSTAVVELRTYPVSRWRDKLVIRQSGKSYFEPAHGDQEKKIRYGIHVHTLLSFIRYRDDLEAALNRAIAEGIISGSERQTLQEELTGLLEQNDVAPWFDKQWEVRTEVPILLPGGEESRIDRLLIRDTHAVIIDFKTGSPSKADQQQVLHYIEILRKMNFSKVEGYVLYVRTGVVKEVKSKNSKPDKRKDENQLGLDL